MTADLLPDLAGLLPLCAILRSFDRDLLVTLAGCRDEDLAWLSTSDLVAPAGEAVNGYFLREEVCREVLGRLRAERPLDELTLHARALDHFLRRIEQVPAGQRRPADEDDCLYHLDRLFQLLLPRKEWQTIARHTAAVRAIEPRQARHLQRLTLHEGYVAACTQDHERGEALLTGLLALPDLEHDVRIRALNALAQLHWSLTRYDRALDALHQLAAFARDTGDLVYQGLALVNLGVIYHELEDYARALDLGLQALQLVREQGEQAREVWVLQNIGLNAMYLGRWEVAREHFDEAIRLAEALGTAAPLSFLYWGQGYMHHMLGNEPDSEEAYRRALALAQSPEHGDQGVAMDSWLRLGFLYETRGHWDDALAAYEQAGVVAQRLRNEHRLSRIHYRRGEVLKRQGRLEEALAAYTQGIEHVEALRGVTEREETKIAVLGTTQQLYEATVLLCLELGRPEEAFAYVERARSRAFLDTLAKKSPELYEALDQPVATLAEVQARLPEGALLVEYFTTGVLPRGEHLLNKVPRENERLREHLTLPPQVLIFAVTHDRCEVHRAALNPNALRPPAGDASPGRRLLHPPQLARLHECLIGPVEPLLRGRDLLYLVPHGPLHYVPFLALRSATGAYLLDAGGPAIALAPSATILLRNCLGRPPGRAEGFLALGYNDRGEETLRHAEAEARHLARLMDGTCWCGPQPKGARLLAEGRTARWLHFAGHAVFNPRDPLDSELRLGEGDALSARAIIDGLDLEAELVTLSACTTGLSHVVPGDELLGLQRAFLYAGAPTVVCTLWEAHDLVALLVMERFYGALGQGRDGTSPATALRDAQVAVREMTAGELARIVERWRAEDPEYAAVLGELDAIPTDGDAQSRPFADPFYWAPFMLIGRPHLARG